MKLMINAKEYKCFDVNISPGKIVYKISECPDSIGSEIKLLSDCGDELRLDITLNYLRCYISNNSVVLTNEASIIKATPSSNGKYEGIIQYVGSSIPDGYYCVDESCDTSVMNSYEGFVNFTIVDDVVTEITGNDEVYQEYLSSLPQPATTEPTIEEKNRADIDYLAVMMGVTL